MYILLLSGLFYVIPFWYPALWPLIFLFPALLTLAHLKKITLFSVFLWGLIISVGHILPIAHALYAMSQGPTLFKLVPGTILIGYIATFATLWLVVASRLINDSAWIAGLWLFFLYADRAILLPLSGQLEGNIFMNPLVILPPALLGLLPHVGMSALLGIFCITSSTIGLWFCGRAQNSSLILSLIPWIISIGMAQPYETNFPYKNIGYLPVMVPKESDSSAVFSSKIFSIQGSHPHINTIIAPESSCHQLPIIHSPLNLIMGSFENHETERSNIACWIHDGKQHIFKKTHTMVFGEKLPTWLDNRFFQTLIFSTAMPILKAKNNRPQWKLSPNLTLVPYICSELFFSNSPQERFHDPIVAICNDWWFTLPHFKQLMARAARLRAIQWGRPIIYASYSHGLFFDQFGTTYPIERL